MYEIYTVKNNDTIESISSMFGTTSDDIEKLNGFGKNFVVKSGMQLVVPKKDNDNYLYYTVKKGDNLYNIAKEYGVDVKMLLVLNGLDTDDYIYPNQTLLIPRSNVKIYMTGMNDTILDVMKRYDTSISNLLEDNENIFLRPEQIIVFREK